MVVPDSHPRKASLEVRERLLEGFNDGLIAEAGLIAHGRGEALDYLLGEATRDPALTALRVGVGLMCLADKPCISVNGNVAALCASDVVDLAGVLGGRLEVNLFYHSTERVGRIIRVLGKAGAGEVFGLQKKNVVAGLDSYRGLVDDALWEADCVLVMLEDGDRTEALKALGKKVVCVDLNPLSRSARWADVTIVDNIVRCLPLMVEFAGEAAGYEGDRLRDLVAGFSNEDNLSDMEKLIRSRL
ncbi:MAG: phosphopantothenate/pantothenate synthetase [Candidatus Altiarchaeales archaeon]|nr:phosphopantothenate/pantothenate synthetase [Candidatus Altiarchaeales archaeon]